MQIKKQTGVIKKIQFMPSPNCDARPAGSAIELIVIHCISLPKGSFGQPYIQDLFMNRLDCNAQESFAALRELKVSAHLFINREGEIIQFVSFNKRAWHAGISYYLGRSAVNDFSVGIELEGTDDSCFTDQQYNRLATTTRALLGAYPTMNQTAIVGHSDIAPGRKTDPGKCFDWARFHHDLKK